MMCSVSVVVVSVITMVLFYKMNRHNKEIQNYIEHLEKDFEKMSFSED
jgi:hypothetical protein